MNSVMFLLLAQAAPAAAAAAEAAPASTMDTIVKAVLGLVSMAVTAFLVPYLRNKSKAAQAEADKMTAEAGKAVAEGAKANVEGRGTLVARLKSFLWGEAAGIAEKEFPKLANQIIAGHFKGDGKTDKVKAVLRSWGQTLKEDAIEYFNIQGINIVAALGDKFLDKLIARAANAVSPFPGKDTAVEMLTEKVSNALVEKGVDWIRGKYLSDGATTDAAVAPVAAPAAA